MKEAVLYDKKFYSGQSGGSYQSARIVVPLVNEIIAPSSVCDVGCGVGTWLRAWQEVGVSEIYGIDGDYVDRSQLMIAATSFEARDLRLPLRLGRTFDLAMSLEVAEHLPSDRAESFVAELTSAAPVVLFSAAVPGQGGTDHINEQWQDYWAALFAQSGFDAFDCVRPVIWNDERVERWYRQNIIIFCRRDKVAAYPGLSAVQRLPLAIVHPLQYVERTQEYGVQESFGFFAAALRRSVQRRLGSVGKSPTKPHP